MELPKEHAGFHSLLGAMEFLDSFQNGVSIPWDPFPPANNSYHDISDLGFNFQAIYSICMYCQSNYDLIYLECFISPMKNTPMSLHVINKRSGKQ